MKPSFKRSARKASEFIRNRRDISPAIGIIAGSGWKLANLVSKQTEMTYKEIPGFPYSRIKGHKNSVLMGRCGKADIIIFQGRMHYYEGFSPEEIVFPVQVLSDIGIRKVIITNSAGSMKKNLKPGCFMIINDHLNLMGINPLRGFFDQKGRNGFIDMSHTYNMELVKTTLKLGYGLGIGLQCGVLAAVSGPSYETPAEIRMLRSLGADAVCMSAIPEVIMARYLDIDVLGLSVITNYAAGIGRTALRHEDVVEVANACSKDAIRLLSSIIKEYSVK